MSKEIPKIDDYMEPQRVRDLLEELRIVAGEVRRLRDRLKEAGLSVE